MFKSIIAFIIIIVAACAAESLTVPEDKTPPVVTLIQHEPEYFENTEIVGSENEFNIEKFSNPEPVPRSGDDVPPFVNGFRDDNTAQESSMLDVVPATQDRHQCVAPENRITKKSGVFNGPSGRETYYNLNMAGCIRAMRSMGYGETTWPYRVCEGCGAKLFGELVMCAANLEIRPKGTVLMTSLGKAIVVDTGSFCQTDKTAVDMCVTW